MRKKGYLSQYFDGVAVKILSTVEVDTLSSNQHEFNGVEGLRSLLGEPTGKQYYPAKFLYITDDEGDCISEEGFLTWYDARQRARLERNVMRWEYRLYFPTNMVTQRASPGDILFIAKMVNDSLLSIVVKKDSTLSQQLLWLFDAINLPKSGFSIRDNLNTDHDKIEFTSRFILEAIGIEVDTSENSYLALMLEKFSGRFPTTKEFSAFSRETLPEVHANDGHDIALMAWIEREEILFRTLERHIISQRLSDGFDGDVDGFITFSLSVQNRRKSRVGLALENHLEHLFQQSGIQYSRAPITENKSKPDFIFPSQFAYHNSDFQPANLTMLGVKSSCKDRWRQVLSEADRIKQKHLLTLEAAISKSQTDEMQTKLLQLVVPSALHSTFLPEQRAWLMSVSDFAAYVLAKQS
jgi:hypothetical protein